MERQKAQKKAEGSPPRPAAGRTRFYKISDVCSMTDTQPYVLRFWESEFPQLAPSKSRSGHRLYTDKDIGLVQKIKALLYEEEYTIAGARKKLEEEGFTAPESERPDPPRRQAAAPEKAAPERAAPEERGAQARAQHRPESGTRAMETLRGELLAIKEMLES